MRLLLAEDEKALSKALVAILERNNYSVDAVYDGQSALDYLAKPFHSKELLARIRAITRTQTAQTNSKLHMGNVILNRAPMKYLLRREASDLRIRSSRCWSF